VAAISTGFRHANPSGSRDWTIPSTTTAPDLAIAPPATQRSADAAIRMIHLDTSVLIDALTANRRSLPELRRVVADSIRLGVSSLVLSEWRRGPRVEEELVSRTAEVSGSAMAVAAPPSCHDLRTCAERLCRTGPPRVRSL